MKTFFLSCIACLILLAPLGASAQMYGGPMGGGPMTPFFEPHRFGFIHEGSLAVAGLTGEGRSDYSGGGGAYYSGLFRPQPSFAFGLHIAGGHIQLGTGYLGDDSTLNYGVVAGEGRIYIPAGMIDLWGSIVIGGGYMDEVIYYDQVDSNMSRSGAVVGFGAGGSFFITPNMSVGAQFRMYRMFPGDNEIEGSNSTASDYYGLWWTFGVVGALHY